MLGKGVTFRDCLMAIAMVLPVAMLAGAAMGYAGNHFGLSGGIRVLGIVAISSMSARIAQVVIMRRVKARSLPGRTDG